jgi:hypothetical protein
LFILFELLKIMKVSFKPYSKILLGLLTFGIILSVVPSVRSQSAHSPLTDQIPSQWQFMPPSRLGIPVGREGGATRAVESFSIFESDDNWNINSSPAPPTRGSILHRERILLQTNDFCANEPLTLIIPQSGKTLTASANPAFYWYLPPNNGIAVEFNLRDSQNQLIYTTRQMITENTLATSNSGKIMGLKLPSFNNFSGLKTGQEYSWEVKLICDQNEPGELPGSMGIVERIPLNREIRDVLPTVSTEESLGIYIDANLWHETINTMIRLQKEKPDDPEIEAAWQKLMDSIQLSLVN